MTNQEFIESIRLEGEEWKDIPGWEGLYCASNFGRFLALSRIVPKHHGHRRVEPHLLIPSIHRNGYIKLTFCAGRKRKTVLAHRLVAMTFIPNPYNKPTIDHIDRNRQNNKVENLRWCTLSENMHNELTVEHCRNLNLGRINRESWRPVVAIKNREVYKIYESIKQAVSDGFVSCAISNVCAGRDKSHRGFRWMYLSDYENLVSMSKNSSTPGIDYPQ